MGIAFYLRVAKNSIPSQVEGLLYCYAPATRSNKTYDMGQMVGTVVLRARGGLLLTLHHRFASFNPQTEQLEIMEDPEFDQPENRFNDDKCDPMGRFWTGTMNLRLTNTPPVRCIAWMGKATCASTRMRSVCRTVSFGHPPNARCTMLTPYVRPLTPSIMISTQAKSLVDAMSIRCRKNSELPTEWPSTNRTGCSFGGKDMDELYITTAKLGLDEKQKSAQPLAADLFVARPGVWRPNWPSFPG